MVVAIIMVFVIVAPVAYAATAIVIYVERKRAGL